MKRLALLGVALLFAHSPALAAPRLRAVLEGLDAERVVTGLRFPVALAAAPDGTLLITEKDGALRAVKDGALLPEPLATFSPVTRNEAGLLGVALAPDFATSRRFFVSYTPLAFQDRIHVVRLELKGESATVLDDPWLALPSRPSTDRHYAANLRFGPRGRLYVSLGELRNEADAQDPTTLPGSVLRYEPDLSIPGDNPFPGSPVFAYGLRNPFALDVAEDGRVFAGDNGADVADEVDLIEPGRNYGWPLVEGHCDHFPKREPCATPALYTDPIHEFRQVIGPTGLAVYDGALMPELRGALLVGGFHSNTVHRLRLASGNAAAEPLPPVVEFSREAGYYAGGIVDVEVAPDGALLVLIGGFSAGDVWRIAPLATAHAARGAPRLAVRSEQRRAGSSCAVAVPEQSREPAWLVAWATLVLLRLRGVRAGSKARRAPKAQLASCPGR